MKCKIVWGKVNHSCYFPVKTSLKFVSSKNKIEVSFCSVFHIAPSPPTFRTRFDLEWRTENFVKRIPSENKSGNAFVQKQKIKLLSQNFEILVPKSTFNVIIN
jgi:hypothetical protein